MADDEKAKEQTQEEVAAQQSADAAGESVQEAKSETTTDLPVTMPETPSVDTGPGTDEEKTFGDPGPVPPPTVENSLDGAADLLDALSAAFIAHVDIPNKPDQALLDSAAKYAAWLRAEQAALTGAA